MLNIYQIGKSCEKIRKIQKNICAYQKKYLNAECAEYKILLEYEIKRQQNEIDLIKQLAETL